MFSVSTIFQPRSSVVAKPFHQNTKPQYNHQDAPPLLLPRRAPSLERNPPHAPPHRQIPHLPANIPLRAALDPRAHPAAHPPARTARPDPRDPRPAHDALRLRGRPPRLPAAPARRLLDGRDGARGRARAAPVQPARRPGDGLRGPLRVVPGLRRGRARALLSSKPARRGGRGAGARASSSSGS